MKLGKLTLAMGLLAFSSVSYAAINGTVYEDLPMTVTTLNTYGVKEANEQGVSGITVTAYPGGVIATTATDGTYSLATGAGDYRIEFTWPAHTWLESSPDAASQNTSVQFVSDGATANFGLHNPANFLNDTNPYVFTPVLISGDPLVNSGSADDARLRNGIVAYQYNNNGAWDGGKPGPAIPPVAPSYVSAALTANVGSTWGVAYQKATKTGFFSTVLARHVGLGPLGIGGLYQVDFTNPTAPVASSFVDLEALGIDFGAEPVRSGGSDFTLSSQVDDPSVDFNAFAAAAHNAMGDLDISEDGKTLWLINLFDRKLYKIDIGIPAVVPTAAQVTAFTISNPGCSGDDWVPWAISIHNGSVYAGVTCTAFSSQTRSDLDAYVLQLNETAGTFSPLFSKIDLDFTRGEISVPANVDADWRPWRDVWSDADMFEEAFRYAYPQPILSDITFDDDGSVLLAFKDRFSLQSGNNNDPAKLGGGTNKDGNSGGDLLRVCNTSGSYTVEGGAGCPQTTGGNGQGNNNVEFYFGDSNINNNNEIRHDEVLLGGTAVMRGRGEIISGGYNPWHDSDSGGTITLSNTTGDRIRAYEIYPDSDDANAEGNSGKAGGIGDIELLTDAAPIEVGNRVWIDTNDNGIQDADEAGIASVIVELISSGAVISTATTDANGNYIFSNSTNGTSTASHKYNLTQLTPAGNYTVRVPNVSGGSKQGVLGTTTLTTANTGEGGNANSNDSDGVASGNDADASVSAAEIPLSGANNHSYDFGFRDAPTTGSITIIKDATPDDPQDFAFTATGTGTSSFSLDDDADATLSNTQTFTGLADGAYSVTEAPVANWLLTGISCTGNTNSTITTNATGVDITLSGNESIVCTFYNNTHSCPAGQLQNVATITANEAETTYANNSDNACIEVTSPSCSIVATATVNACVNGGNDSDTSNDNYTIALTVTGANTSANFDYNSAPAGVSGTAVPFASSPYTTPAIIIESTDSPLTLTVTDSVDNSCSTTITPVITEPVTCSNVPSVDLRLVKTVDKTTALSGDTLVYTITVTNDGPSDATGVQITDNLPAGLTYQSHVAEAGTTFTSGTGIWDIGGVTVGQTVTLDITVTVN